MKKLKYKPVAIQDECFGGSKKQPDITVLIKFCAKGKTRIYEKKDAITFPNSLELKRYVRQNHLKVIPHDKFKVSLQEDLLHLLKAV